MKNKIDISETVDALQELGKDTKKQIEREVKRQSKRKSRKRKAGSLGVILIIIALAVLFLSKLGNGFGLPGGGEGGSLFGGSGTGDGDGTGNGTNKVAENTINNTASVNPTQIQDNTGNTPGDGYLDGKLTITIKESDVFFGDEKLESVEKLSDKLGTIDRNNLPEIYLVDEHAIMSVYDRAEAILKEKELAYNGD